MEDLGRLEDPQEDVPFEESATPPEMKEKAQKAIESLIPTKSSEIYIKYYDQFVQYLSQNKSSISYASENKCLAFFEDLSSKYAASTLWTIFSCISKMLLINHGVDTKQWKAMKAFLKKRDETHIKKKSNTFSREDLDGFLKESDNEQDKLALLIGLCGGMRPAELTFLQWEHITEESASSIFVNIPKSKTDKAQVGWKFTVRKDPTEWKCPLSLLSNYKKRVPETNGRLFVQYHNGKYTKQVRGKNWFNELPQRMATFLKKEEPKRWTGHAIRRTTATLLADSGVSLTNLKRAGRWKSDSVAEGYIAESKYQKKDIAERIQNISNTDTIIQIPPSNIAIPLPYTMNFTNCTITMNISK